MSEILIIGLGPGPRKKLTVEVNDILKNADKVYFRTTRHNIANEYINSGKNYFSYDSFYDEYEDFDSLYEAIALDLINSAKKEKKIIYAVPGNPKLDDRILEYLDKKVDDIKLNVLYGIGISEAAIFKSSIFSIEEFITTNALSVEKHFYDYKNNNLITGIFNRYIASDLKMLLLDYYKEDHLITFINNPMDENEVIKRVKLEDLDRLDSYGHLTSVFIESNKDLEGFANLTQVMEHLRSDEGCSWDRKQTINDLIPYMIEEVYEVISAIEEENYEALEEELGDLLLQVIFQAQIVSERGYFDIYDVINKITKKMIRRHPHIYNDSSVNDFDWDDIKKEEYDESYIYESMERTLKSLPSLMSAHKIQDKASKNGFDWDDVSGAIDKLYEEIDELKDAIDENDKSNIEEEFGDILFSVVNIARFVKVNPEITLRNTNKKFISRFKYMEEYISKKGVKFSSLSLDEMEKLWQEAKIEKKEKKA